MTGPGTSAFAVFLERYRNHEFEQAAINISLGVVVVAIALSIALSVLFPPRKTEKIEPEEPQLDAG